MAALPIFTFSWHDVAAGTGENWLRAPGVAPVSATELPDVITTCPTPRGPRLRCLLLSFLASPLGLLVLLTGVLQLLGPG